MLNHKRTERLYREEPLAVRRRREKRVSIPRVVAELEHLAGTRTLPAVIVCDNGSEFTSRAFDAWAYRRGIKLLCIRPGKPVDNAFIESFHGRFRDECLSEQWCTSPPDARELIEQWRREYNGARPHSALAGRPPSEFAKACSGVSRSHDP